MPAKSAKTPTPRSRKSYYNRLRPIAILTLGTIAVPVLAVAITWIISKILPGGTVCSGWSGLGCVVYGGFAGLAVMIAVPVVIARKLITTTWQQALKLNAVALLASSILTSLAFHFVAISGHYDNLFNLIGIYVQAVGQPYLLAELMVLMFVGFWIGRSVYVLPARRYVQVILVLFIGLVGTSWWVARTNTLSPAERKTQQAQAAASIIFKIYRPTKVPARYVKERDYVVNNNPYTKGPQPSLSLIFTDTQSDHLTINQFVRQPSYNPPTDCRSTDPVAYDTTIAYECRFIGHSQAGCDVYAWNANEIGTSTDIYCALGDTMFTLTTSDKLNDAEALTLVDSVKPTTMTEVRSLYTDTTPVY